MIWSIVVGVAITPFVAIGLIFLMCYIRDNGTSDLTREVESVNRLPMLGMIQDEVSKQGAGDYDIYVSPTDFKFLADTFFGGSADQPEFMMAVSMTGSEVCFHQHSMCPEGRFYLMKDLVVGCQFVRNT